MKIYNLALFPIILVTITFAQKQPTTKIVKQCNAQLARQLVEQQADFSKSIADNDKRINVLIKVADYLWSVDEESARKYFAEAFQVAQNRFREKGTEPVKSGRMILSRIDYRFEVIRAVAKRDGEWSRKLSEIVLKEFDEDKEKDKRDSYDQDREVDELLRLARQVAKDNPNLALTLARRVMRYPLNRLWFSTLYTIAQNNQQLADQIYVEALAQNSNAEIFRLLFLSAYPFGQSRILGVEKQITFGNVPANFSQNPNLKRQFLLTLFKRVITLTPESTAKSLHTETPEPAVALFALNELEPTISQQFPDLLPIYSQARIHATSIVSNDILDSEKRRSESRKIFDKLFAERLEEIEKAEREGKLKDAQIVLLIIGAEKEEDYKSAETWLDKIVEEKVKEETKNFFYFQRSKLASQDNRFEEAQKFAEKVTKTQLRAVVYFDIAEAKQKNPATKSESLDALLEVYKMTQKAPETEEKAQVLLALANIYEKVDHFSALDALSGAVKTANKLENLDLFTNSTSYQIIGKGFAYYIGYDVPGFDISETFGEISKNDFQGALLQAENFTDRYIRTLAVLASVKDCESVKPIKAKPKASTK